MKKHLVYLLIVAVGLIACRKQHQDPTPPRQNTPPTIDSSKKYVLYSKVDTSYDYYSTTQFYLDVTHETLTGDTIYLKAGTAAQTIQPNPIAGYDPKTALADTLTFSGNGSGTENSPGRSIVFTYDLSTHNFSSGFGTPGQSSKIFVINDTTVEVVAQNTDPDGGLTYANGSYFKKL